MKEYWNEQMTPRPGVPIKEVKLVDDNVYIEDEQGNVWQFVVAFPDEATLFLIERR